MFNFLDNPKAPLRVAFARCSKHGLANLLNPRFAYATLHERALPRI